MAWFTKTLTVAPAAGDLLAWFEDRLLTNGHWTIHDAAAGANRKVFRCYDVDNAVDFYLDVNDNVASYATVRMWEAWNEITHAGSGASTPAAGYIRKGGAAVTWWMALSDWRFIFICGNPSHANYVGMLHRADVSKNCPCVCLAASTGQTGNPVGSASNIIMLWNEQGTPGVVTSLQYGTSTERQYKTYGGEYVCYEAPIGSEDRYQGVLNGAVVLYSSTAGLLAGDEVTMGGVKWVGVGTSLNRFCLVRMS